MDSYHVSHPSRRLGAYSGKKAHGGSERRWLWGDACSCCPPSGTRSPGAAALVSLLLFSRLRMFLYKYEQDNPTEQFATDQPPLFKPERFQGKHKTRLPTLVPVTSSGGDQGKSHQPAPHSRLHHCSLEAWCHFPPFHHLLPQAWSMFLR